MPNWCSNRMYFSGEPAQIAEIKRLASGAVTPLYRRATNEGIQLFLAGSAGLLQITENIRSEQCPGVTAAGRGAVSLENIAFIDRNLNPQKTKKAPQNGCFFNTPCAPYERKRLLNRMTLIDTGYEWRFFAPFPVKWTQLPLCGSQPHTCCRASRSCIRTSSASR